MRCNLFDFTPKEMPLLATLEVLQLSRSMISSTNLAKLLSQTPCLKSLDLSAVECLSEDFDSEINLPHLEKLELYKFIHPNNLKNLLSKASCLKKIKLSQADLRGVSFSDYDFSSLQSLDVTHSTINIEEFNKLKEKYPKLIIKGVSFSKASVVPADPIHDPLSQRNFAPTTSDFKFEYKGENKLLNQAMIIEKLSQYLTLTGKHSNKISKLQDGICTALSNYFNEESLDNWKIILNRFSAWDGKPETLEKELTDQFKKLWKYIKKYQFASPKPVTYLGDEYINFLKVNRRSHILSNPWHAISIKYSKENNRWTIYDPNYIDGSKEVLEENLKVEIEKGLGKLIFVSGNFSIKATIDDPDTFLAEGGLLALCKAQNREQLLSLVPITAALSRQALDGLLLRSVDGIPAWAQGMKTPLLVSYTLQLLQQFVMHYEEEASKKIQASLQGIEP